jgi:hypothetical protein
MLPGYGSMRARLSKEDFSMQIEVVKKDRTCFAENCPAQLRVIGLPGWTLYVGKKPETLLDREALDQLREHVGPDEYATLVPDSL